MGNKIFVSYKYADKQVRPLSQWQQTTVRDYVDILQGKIDRSDHIYKGEDDGEDMSSLADATIGSKLGDKIFDSSVTIVFISKGMKEPWESERDQWIPWEISYSLKEQSRQGQRSKTNAVLAVVLPDEYGSYAYFIDETSYNDRITLKTSTLFEILRANMFNLKDKSKSTYPKSYIHSVKWDHFINDINGSINIALDIRTHINEYDIRKSV
jgi:hypothetical protein